MSFWEPWQLWVKMTFVLACAIVVVVGLGICKQIWMHRNLQKHVKLLQERQAEQKALMARPSVRERKRKAEIPFGIRAIESGVEIEGVWISRPTSVVNSRVASPSQSGTSTPVSPDSRYLHGTETPVSGAARVLAAKAGPSAARASSDPFRDSKSTNTESLASRVDDYSSSSSGSTLYHDLPDVEAGHANVRIPSNHSLRSDSWRSAQPAVYRPTGTPDNVAGTTDAYITRNRRSYIPVDLQSRALNAVYLNDPSPPGYDHVQQPRSRPVADATLDNRQSQLFGSVQQSDHRSSFELSSFAPTGSSSQANAGSDRWHPANQSAQTHRYRTSSETGTPIEQAMVTPTGNHVTENLLGRDRSGGFEIAFNSERTGLFDSSADEVQGSRIRPADGSPPYHFSKSHMPHEEPGEYARQREEYTRAAAPRRLQAQSPTTVIPTGAHQPGLSFANRAEAEAARSDMRRVNDGFSVSRHGVRRDRASLIAEAEGLREERERRERQNARARQPDVYPGEKEGRRKLQKRRASKDLLIANSGPSSSGANRKADRRRDSQFKEDM